VTASRAAPAERERAQLRAETDATGRFRQKSRSRDRVTADGSSGDLSMSVAGHVSLWQGPDTDLTLPHARG